MNIKQFAVYSILCLFSVLKIGNHILHFGGTAVPFGITSTNRLYDLDLHTLEWKCCSQSADTPSEKYGHVSSNFI